MTATLVTDVVTQPEVPIWPGAAPGSEDWTHQEFAEVQEDTGWYVIHNVVVPTLTPVLPAPGTANATAMIVAPGGAYVGLAWDHEGLSTAQWLADRGITAFVLKYRLLEDRGPAALADAPPLADRDAFFAWMREKTAPARAWGALDGEQAVRVLRGRADEWGIDPARVGIIGYSAGGSLALNTAMTTDPHARPDLVIAVYSAYVDRDVPADAPPLFGVVAADDPLGSYLLETTRDWVDAGTPAELHVYERGGHGFSIHPTEGPVATWSDRLADWLDTRGLLAKPETEA